MERESAKEEEGEGGEQGRSDKHRTSIVEVLSNYRSYRRYARAASAVRAPFAHYIAHYIIYGRWMYLLCPGVQGRNRRRRRSASFRRRDDNGGANSRKQSCLAFMNRILRHPGGRDRMYRYRTDKSARGGSRSPATRSRGR